jgi:hypothetical protein
MFKYRNLYLLNFGRKNTDIAQNPGKSLLDICGEKTLKKWKALKSQNG